MSQREQVIYVECGTTLSTKFTTGIQRVVKSLLGELEKVGPDSNVRIIPVIFTGKDIVSIEQSLETKATTQSRGVLFKCIKNIDKALVFSPITKGYTFVLRVKNRIGSILGKRNPQSIFYRDVDDNSDLESPPILLLIDSSWYMELFPLLEQFKKGGGKIVLAQAFILIDVLLEEIIKPVNLCYALCDKEERVQADVHTTLFANISEKPTIDRLYQQLSSAFVDSNIN